MPQYRFAVVRRSLIEETFWVQADTPEEAVDKAGNGARCGKNTTVFWLTF